MFAPYDEMLRRHEAKSQADRLAQFLELISEGKVATTSSQSQSSEVAQMSACQPLPHLQNEFHLPLQHARLPCPSLSPGACSDLHSLSVMPSMSFCRRFLLLLLAFALLHFVGQGQTCLCTSGSLKFLLLHSNPLWWKGLFSVSSRSCRSSYSRSASSALVVGAQTWITVKLTGLPWK